MEMPHFFSIALPNEMAYTVKGKVAANEYITESEVIRDGLCVMLARNRAVEHWLLKQVEAAYDAPKFDSSRAVTVDLVRMMLAAEYRKATAKA